MAWHHTSIEWAAVDDMMRWFCGAMMRKKPVQQAVHPVMMFPYLQSLMHGYFHQDYDIVGDSIASIVAEYKATAHGYELMGLKADIARFKHQFADDADEKFVTIFSPDIDPVAWSGSTIAWLDEVEKALG